MHSFRFLFLIGVSKTLLLLAGILMAAVSVAGYVILDHIANKKWGYTREREEKLEKADQLGEADRGKR